MKRILNAVAKSNDIRWIKRRAADFRREADCAEPGDGNYAELCKAERTCYERIEAIRAAKRGEG